METTEFLSMLAAYWSPREVVTNILIFFNLGGALLLGMLVGYERSYRGRAAGMRTYSLVCMASAGLTVITGYPTLWFSGTPAIAAAADPTRVIQGIVTGIGFLCAGVIMKEGFNISGLTTAASIWATSVIGILIGVGFYASAILLALMSAICMMWGGKVEGWLPSRHAIAVVMRFRSGYTPHEDVLRDVARKRGYEIAGGSLSVNFSDSRPEWHFVAVATNSKSAVGLTDLANELTAFEGVETYSLSHARN